MILIALSPKAASRVLEILECIDIRSRRWHVDQGAAVSGQLLDEFAKTDIAYQFQRTRIQPSRQNRRCCAGRIDSARGQAARRGLPAPRQPEKIAVVEVDQVRRQYQNRRRIARRGNPRRTELESPCARCEFTTQRTFIPRASIR